MLSVDEARSKSLELHIAPRSELCAVERCGGRRLVNSLYASDPLPRWDHSAMDGYAMGMGDAQAGQVAEVVEVIPAGTWPERALEPGEAARIFTGAPIPRGAEVVVLQEDTEALSQHDAQSDDSKDLGQVRILESAQLGQHIRRRGEEWARDELIASAKTPLNPGLLGLCAAQGLAELEVFARPRVALLETGSELVRPGLSLSGAQIYATHAATLRAMIEQSGGQLTQAASVSDSVDEVVEMISALRDDGVDLIITTGGVSVGDFDPLHAALERLGAERRFWKVRMKPGKPVSVASLPNAMNQTPIMSLPGNPVSCVVSYLLFVHPLIQRAAGVPEGELGLKVVEATLAEPLIKRHHRAEFMRVRLTRVSREMFGEVPPSLSTPRWRCERTGGQSSAWISSVAQGDGLLHIPETPVEWDEGQRVMVSLFPWVDLNRV